MGWGFKFHGLLWAFRGLLMTNPCLSLPDPCLSFTIRKNNPPSQSLLSAIYLLTINESNRRYRWMTQLSRNQTKLRVGEDLIIIGRLLLYEVTVSQWSSLLGVGRLGHNPSLPYSYPDLLLPSSAWFIDLCGSILSFNTGYRLPGTRGCMYMYFVIMVSDIYCVMRCLWSRE